MVSAFLLTKGTETVTEAISEIKETIELVTEKASETEAIQLEGFENANVNLPIGLVVGVFVGVVALVLILSLVIWNLTRKRKHDMSGYYEDKSNTLSPLAPGNTTIKITKSSKDCPVQVASIHDVGRRSMQQDSFGLSDTEDKELVQSKGVLVVVADGMGGLADGERMSQMVVVNILQGFDHASPAIPTDTLLRSLVEIANDAVNQDLGEEKIGKCGSTVVAAIIKDNRLFWISVGDSHIYVFRNGKLVKMNHDHNYGAQLDESAARGEITMEEALADKQRAALTSFIGIGELELIDQNSNPIGLEKGDRILLMSDGIYGTVSFEHLQEILGQSLKQACLLIDQEIHEKNKINQDNYTCVILEMR